MSPPSPPTTPVVAAVIQREGRYLVCQRPADKRHGGLWEFPGGKVHEGESLGEAVERELREELRLTTLSVGAVPRFAAPDPASSFLILFLDTEAAGEPHPIEHQALGWFPPGELSRLPLAPSDLRFVEEILVGG